MTETTPPGGEGSTKRGPGPRADLAGLTQAIRSIERGENPAAPAPRGDAAEARRRRREAMTAEAALPEGQAQAAPPTDPAPTGAAPQGEVAPDARPAGAPQGGGELRDQPEPADDPATTASTPPEGHKAPRAAGPAPAEAAPPRGPAVDAARTVLTGGGAPAALAEDAVRTLGERAAETLRSDPWSVLALPGVGPAHADSFARAVLGPDCGPGDPRRAGALVAHLMEFAAERGHTALAADALRTALAQQSVPDPAAAVAAAVEDGRVLVFRDDRDDPGDRGVSPASAGLEHEEDDDGADETGVSLLLGLDRYALAEESLADGCVRLMQALPDAAGAADTANPADATDTAGTATAAVAAHGPDGPRAPGLTAQDWAKAAAQAPSPSAAELIRAVAAHGLVLHTGGEAARAEPAALVAAARAAGLRAYAAAYTGDGRRRLARAIGDEEAAVTVEALLEGAQGPGRAPDGTLALDLLAVLDAPQLSVVEATDLVEALADGVRLVLSGDPYTLWSAGPGRVFADLLAARACPRVTSRTPDPGPIGELVSCVGEGELPAVDAPDREVVVVPVRDPQEAVHRAVQLVADSVPRVIGVPAGQTQVIVPAHGGPAGTRALNAALKERLNPGPGRFGGFDPGDRVVYVPRPGRAVCGLVAGAVPEGLRLECDGEEVVVAREEVAARVRHGWAVTGHQAAGTRWPAVVVVVPGDAGPLLTRSWVYTAFSRGERHVSVVHADQVLGPAVSGLAQRDRTTRLASVLGGLLAEG